MTETAPKKRRSNAEILEALKAERKAPKKRVRRTNTQIARDNRLAEKKAQEQSQPQEQPEGNKVTVITFHKDMIALGNSWKAGSKLALTESSGYTKRAYDKEGNLVLNKSPEEQRAAWGEVRYSVGEETIE